MKRRRHRLRYVIAVLALLVVIGALGGVKYGQISTLMAFGAEMQKAGPPPESVGSTEAKEASWEATLTAVGSVQGVQSVAVAAELPGTVKRILFDSGSSVKQGQVLVALDARTELAQLRAAEARRELVRTNADRAKQLVDQGAIPRAEYDDAQTAFATAVADVAAARALVDRKSVRAPFAGRAGIRAVNLGQYLAPGTVVTTIESLGDMYVDFALPQQQLAQVSIGDQVRIATPADAFTGAILAIDPTVDPATRNVKLRAHVLDQAGKLRSGMFVTVTVVLPARERVVIVPQTAIVHAAYGSSVFVIEDKPPGSPGMAQTPDGRPVRLARQQFVKLGAARGDFIAIAEGVKPGQRVVSEGAFKLRNGAPIAVDDRVKPKAELDPHPENR